MIANDPDQNPADEPLSPDGDLVSLAREFRDGLLDGRSSAGMCAVVCWPLQGYLSFCGIESDVEMLIFRQGNPLDADNHVLLRLTDGRILDPTADQFGLPAVYLGPLPEIYRECMRRE